MPVETPPCIVREGVMTAAPELPLTPERLSLADLLTLYDERGAHYTREAIRSDELREAVRGCQ